VASFELVAAVNVSGLWLCIDPVSASFSSASCKELSSISAELPNTSLALAFWLWFILSLREDRNHEAKSKEKGRNKEEGNG